MVAGFRALVFHISFVEDGFLFLFRFFDVSLEGFVVRILLVRNDRRIITLLLEQEAEELGRFLLSTEGF